MSGWPANDQSTFPDSFTNQVSCASRGSTDIAGKARGQVDVGHHRRPAVTRPTDEEDLLTGAADQPVEVGVDEVQARRGAPVTEQPRLDVLGRERLAQQGVGP